MKGLRKSQQLFEEAQRYLPGGVDSPVRSFKAIGGTPLFIRSGKGSHIYDADGNEYIDYLYSWGPLILGHADRRITTALKGCIDSGTSFGASTELETRLARMICEAMPSIEMVRFVNSGTEAAMTALRLARAYTGRTKIIKFAGCYHGHSDGLLVSGGSGMATLGIPDSPGIPEAVAHTTLVAKYNDSKSVTGLFEKYAGDIAAVIVEPVAANMGVVLPSKAFLNHLRRMTRKYGALLIFDEVITGFRIAYGGAQEIYGIKPDLTCLGKIIGGGLPVGAYGGRRDIMQLIAPAGKVYQAGTLSGNPLAMTAGIETLNCLKIRRNYQKLEDLGAALQEGLASEACCAGIPVTIPRTGSLLTMFFTSRPVTDYDSAKLSDTGLFASFFKELLRQGIYWPPSQFEAAFISLAHTEGDIKATLNATRYALNKLSRS
ncbi:MAG: glutamate-1-semialdehyde 2,1-aminomutase [Dehalococcoidia bacterium]|nr:glutamate-1-semialdehyde 2,1-aminomutase [Dehalococcoidia bacterium]